MAGLFAYAIMNFFFLPTGGTFGSNITPAEYEYEYLARARYFLAEHISIDEPLIMKCAAILNLVEFDVYSDPSS